MGFLERFKKGSRQVGQDLVEQEARQFGLGEGGDVGEMVNKTGELGGSFGLGENTITRASIQGTNAARGDKNEAVRGFKPPSSSKS